MYCVLFCIFIKSVSPWQIIMLWYFTNKKHYKPVLNPKKREKRVTTHFTSRRNDTFVRKAHNVYFEIFVFFCFDWTKSKNTCTRICRSNLFNVSSEQFVDIKRKNKRMLQSSSISGNNKSVAKENWYSRLVTTDTGFIWWRYPMVLILHSHRVYRAMMYFCCYVTMHIVENVIRMCG